VSSEKRLRVGAKSKVDYLDGPLLIDENVLWFKVSVADSIFMAI